MKFEVLVTSEFKRSSKPLLKKYKSLKSDLLDLVLSLEENPYQGVPLGSDCYKVRVSIRSKGKGKSGGARIITCVKIIKQSVYLITIYDKSDRDSISKNELSKLLESLKEL